MRTRTHFDVSPPTVGPDCVPSSFVERSPSKAIDRPWRPQTQGEASVYVCNDNAGIGRAAARYFESLGRFASYGFVPDADNCEWSQIRGRAFAEELDERLGGVSVSVASAPLADWLLSMQKPAAILAAKALDDILRRRKPCGGTTIVCPYVGITERDSTTVVPPAVHLVREAKAYIAAHALEGTRVEEVVRHLGVSARLAQLRFSQAVGHSIREELILRRLNEVKRLLAETPYPPRRIARRCGFKSTIVLAHLFRSHEGCSMRAWRAGHASETL